MRRGRGRKKEREREREREREILSAHQLKKEETKGTRLPIGIDHRTSSAIKINART